ncbi:MAG TPA: maleylpyruvate isomerase family mycothiol-dependent enzyme [Cryptosporangiaceae bacterium]|nr:maleylpyruvate isomerase family mycothiol-dependent enzyme [Cryptosporangiaceae bacterium]
MEPTALGPRIDVRALFAPERQALVGLLDSLDAREWTASTPCPAWSVHELAVHVLHDDVRRLSAQRDGHAGSSLSASTLDELADALDEVNRQWVRTVAPALSPRLTVEALAWLAAASEALLTGLTPDQEGPTVAWAGSGPHPNWLDVAREFTERWVHQQQIREAVGQPGLAGREYVEPVVDTFARALPASLPERPPGTEVQLRVSRPVDRSWTVRCVSSGWRFVELSASPAAVVELPAETLWRRAVRMTSREQAVRNAHVDGDPHLAAAVLDIRAAIVPDEAS